jgi:hypothetical protein
MGKSKKQINKKQTISGPELVKKAEIFFRLAEDFIFFSNQNQKAYYLCINVQRAAKQAAMLTVKLVKENVFDTLDLRNKIPSQAQVGIFGEPGVAFLIFADYEEFNRAERDSGARFLKRDWLHKVFTPDWLKDFLRLRKSSPDLESDEEDDAMVYFNTAFIPALKEIYPAELKPDCGKFSWDEPLKDKNGEFIIENGMWVGITGYKERADSLGEYEKLELYRAMARDYADVCYLLGYLLKEKAAAETDAKNKQIPKTDNGKVSLPNGKPTGTWYWKLYETTLKVFVDAVLERFWPKPR